jgi:hypothetical protein
VVDVEGDLLVVDIEGVRTPLRTPASELPIQMKPAMKLGRRAAEVSGLRGTPVFSADNHPHRASEQGAALAQDASAVADLANFNLRRTETALGATDLAQLGGSPDQQVALASAQQALRDSLHDAGSTTPLSATQPAGGASAFDALLVNFVVAAPRVLDRPYAMVFVRYLEQPGNSQTARVRIFPLLLARVDAKPRRFHLLRAGLPPGYELERCEVHLFERGREVPTNVSARQVAITTDEAFQYTLAGHLADLRTATQPPMPARDFWPADLEARLGEGNRNRLVFVRVEKNGEATGAFHDERGTLRIAEPEIESLLPDLRFFPALAKGKPVPGMCRVNLGDKPL